MYVQPNFKSKAELKRAVAAGRAIEVYQPNADVTGFNGPPANGTVHLEGPHYPEPHKWYAKGTMQDGKLIKVV